MASPIAAGSRARVCHFAVYLSPLGSGYWRLHVDHVLEADEGFDLDFLMGKRGPLCGEIATRPGFCISCGNEIGNFIVLSLTQSDVVSTDSSGTNNSCSFFRV